MRTYTENRSGLRRARGGVIALMMAPFLALAGCDLDLTNPNAPTEEEAFSDIEGLIALAVGMQGQFASSLNTFVRAPALVTDEWGTRTAALAADNSLVTGQGVDPAFGVVSGPYQATFRVIRSANDIIANAPQVGFGPGFEAGMIALARLHKAMALGMAIQQFEQIPTDADVGGAPLQSRDQVLQVILSELTQAREVFTQPGLDFTGFNQRVRGPGFDVRNTIDAMLARYHMMAGNYAEAIAAADRVDLTVLSQYVFPDPATNPVYNYQYGLNYTAPRRSLVDDAEAGDQRPNFWLYVDDEDVPTPAFDEIPLQWMRQYDDRSDPFPVYLPGEMLLIKAEAHARMGNLGQAIDYINEVRTQCASPVNEPTACLPPWTPVAPTQEEVLRQIAHERRYELFLQGLRWEDMRRFSDVIDETPSLMWLPVPRQECDANPAINC
jgi:starch-binding outer membrane protein, SusD/RagB family